MKTTNEILSESRAYVDIYDISYVLIRTCSESRTYYSVTVTLFNTKTAKAESKSIRDITGDPDEAAKIFRLICDGAVTPMTLEDVVCDLIS